MRAVVQRADGAQVAVAGEVVGGFDGPGLVVLIGVTHDDTPAKAEKLAAKVYQLRIFPGESVSAPAAVDAGGQGAPGPDSGEPAHGEPAKAATQRPRETSAADRELPVLVISQFTLYGATAKGRRPTWDAAAKGDVAEPLVDHVATTLRQLGADVSTGVFGADMRVSLTNDGPFTVLVDV